MNLRAIQCINCRQPLPDNSFNAGFKACPNCGATVQARLYPALFRELSTIQAGQIDLVEGESSCFYHEDKKAAVHCAHCGRFLCQLCDMLIENRHLCPQCILSQLSKGQLETLQRGRFLYHNLALSLAVLNWIVGWCMLGLPGMLAIFFGVRAWTAPPAIYQKTRLNHRLTVAVAVILGITSTALWLIFAIYVLLYKV